MDFIVTVARGAAIFAAFMAEGSPYHFKFFDQTPLDLGINVEPNEEFPFTSRVIVPAGSQLDQRHEAPTFGNPPIENLRPGCGTVFTARYCEGTSTDFHKNTQIGEGEVSYDAIRSVLAEGQTVLPGDSLSVATQVLVSSRGMVRIDAKVYDVATGRYLTSVPVQFLSSGCLPPDVMRPMIAQGAQELEHWTFVAAQAAVDKALAVMRVTTVDVELDSFHQDLLCRAQSERSTELLLEVLLEIERLTTLGQEAELEQAETEAEAGDEEEEEEDGLSSSADVVKRFRLK